MVRFIIVFVQAIFILPLSAQQRFYSIANDTSEPNILSWILTQPDTIGFTKATLQYELSFIPDTLTRKTVQNLVEVQTDGAVSKYYGLRRHVQDCIMTGLDKMRQGMAKIPGVGGRYIKTEEEEAMDAIAGVEDILNCEIWQYPTSVTERVHDYRDDNCALVCQESKPNFGWVLLNEPSRKICGYSCYAAQTNFRGRHWTAWYTSDISMAVGPWKFCGLPGAILAVEDAQRHYAWQCVAIQTTNKPIICFHVTERNFQRQQLQRYLTNIHHAPLSILGHDGTVRYYSRASHRWLDDSWSIPYNPIERE